MQGLWQVANSAGWVVPYEHVCWVSERPAEVHADQRARLHCVDGPALRYRDGWSVYAWKGAKLSTWMIETPNQITPAAIDHEFDPAVRDCMIEIMTPEPAISVLSAVEGLELVTPRFTPYVLHISIVILIALFAIQSRGTAKVAAWFGPIILVWFAVLGASGAAAIIQRPKLRWRSIRCMASISWQRTAPPACLRLEPFFSV